jgi:hypothetical protein
MLASTCLLASCIFFPVVRCRYLVYILCVPHSFATMNIELELINQMATVAISHVV